MKAHDQSGMEEWGQPEELRGSGRGRAGGSKPRQNVFQETGRGRCRESSNGAGHCSEVEYGEHTDVTICCHSSEITVILTRLFPESGI